MEGYSEYEQFIKGVVDKNDISSFKTNPIYRCILEHVSPEQGVQYYNLIREEFHLEDNIIRSFCQINDSLGNPELSSFSFGSCSPSSLRYVYLSNLILTHMKKLEKQSVTLTEVGGGYGGLCLAIHYFSKYYNITIEKYNLIDLEQVIRLQKLYLDSFAIQNVEYHDASTFGTNIKDKDMYLIATYSFSEIREAYRYMYISELFPKVSHGFMVWNTEVITDFGMPYTVEKERPLTGPLNRFLYF
jgi:hypothetical protein